MNQNIAIFADNALQHVAVGVTGPIEAIEDFDAKVGINPHGQNINDLAEDYEFFLISDAQVAEIEADDTAWQGMSMLRLPN